MPKILLILKLFKLGLYSTISCSPCLPCATLAGQMGRHQLPASSGSHHGPVPVPACITFTASAPNSQCWLHQLKSVWKPEAHVKAQFQRPKQTGLPKARVDTQSAQSLKFTQNWSLKCSPRNQTKAHLDARTANWGLVIAVQAQWHMISVLLWVVDVNTTTQFW